MSCEHCTAYAGLNLYCLNGHLVNSIGLSVCCDDFNVRYPDDD